MPGQLFTHYFLTDGIKATAEWKASLAQPEAFAAFRDGVRQKYEALSRSADPNEAAFDHSLTRDLILAYMNALSAGDTMSVVAV